MDGWYKIPPNSGPRIHKADKVFHDQAFNLLIFFSGYSADKNNNLHVRYDVQVYDPQGNPTEDKGSDLLAYQGPMGNPQALMLNQQYLKIIFTEKYPVGTYIIKVTAYDKNSSKSFISETPIELLPFTLPDKFSSQEEANEWMMKYHTSLKPIQAINALQEVVQLDNEWIDKNLNVLSFFRRIYADNPFLFKVITKYFASFSIEDKKKFLLISTLAGDTSLVRDINSTMTKDLREYLNKTTDIKIPSIDDEISSAVQLDILWSEFLSTGKYDPIKKIVSALALEKYKGTLEKISSGENVKLTEDIKRSAYLEATYQSAIWSLLSNIKQMPLVFKYCIFMYEHEELDDNIKNQLGSILRIAQEELQRKNEAK